MNGSLLYVVVPAFLLMVGFFSLYFQDIFAAGVITMRGVFFWCALSYLLLIPAITMRSFAEEFRSGSFELMATMPISDEELVLGKYLAALALLALTLLLTCTYPITLSLLGSIDWGAVVGGHWVFCWGLLYRHWDGSECFDKQSKQRCFLPLFFP